MNSRSPSRAAAAIAAAALPLLAVPSAARAQEPEARLPDLVQRAPQQLRLSERGSGRERRFRLGFRSEVDNLGTGPLVLRGHRASVADPTMNADQIVELADGTTVTHEAVGEMRYVVSPGHDHWHLDDFERYELRGRGALRRDRKTGFCLGDRYNRDFIDEGPFEPLDPVFTHNCGVGKPRRLEITAGISVGYGDYYAPNLEGQHVDLTGLPAGRYTLTHRVNVERRLLEADYSNNSASIELRLSWPRGRQARPRVKQLGGRRANSVRATRTFICRRHGR